MATLSSAGTAGSLPAGIGGTGISGGGSDGNVTWSVAGQSGSTVYLQADTGIGSASLTAANTIRANASKGGSSYVSFVTSDPANFTVDVTSNGNSSVRFRKGTGGGH